MVNREQNKFASAHDLRRAFGNRWAAKVMPVVLQQLMRHESIETTLKYYVEQDAEALGAELWRFNATPSYREHDVPTLDRGESRK